MLEAQIFKYIRCCVTKSPLRQATDDQVQRVNHMIAEGQLRDRLDRKLSDPIQGGLINEDASLMYPVNDGIPTLIADEAIVLPETLAFSNE